MKNGYQVLTTKSRPMTDADLDNMTHELADKIEEYIGAPIDRCDLNDRLEAILAEFGVMRIE